MKYLQTFISAILAGICIGIGGVVFLSLDDKVIGSVLFTTGLFFICIFGLNLYTGKVAYVFQNDAAYASRIPIIWLGNLVGTWLMGQLVLNSRIITISEKAKSLCEVKMNDSLLSLFLLGILCNVMIYVAVEGYGKAPHECAKYIALFLGVVVFILSGYEHCIADMFYFSAADMWNGESFLRVLVITLGNAVGGVFFPVVRSWLAKTAA